MASIIKKPSRPCLGWIRSTAPLRAPCCVDGSSTDSMPSLPFSTVMWIRLSVWSCQKASRKTDASADFDAPCTDETGTADLVPMRTTRPSGSRLCIAHSDNCVFYKSNCVVCVYADGFMGVAADDAEIKQLQMALESEFKLNDPGIPVYSQESNSTSMRMDLSRFTDINTSERGFPTFAWRPVNQNHTDGTKGSLNYVPKERDLDEDAKSRFGTAIGSLTYHMVGTGIAFTLGTFSRFTSRPQWHHQAALQRLLRYTKATQFYRITYSSGQLIRYTDADSGGSVVTDVVSSTSGYVFKLAGAPVSWSKGKW